MAITTKKQRQQRRNEALQLIADGVPPTDTSGSRQVGMIISMEVRQSYSGK